MLLMMVFGCAASFACNLLKKRRDVVLRDWSNELVQQITKTFKRHVVIKQKFAQQFLFKYVQMKSTMSAVKIKVCYHGTLEHNHKSIIQSNLMVPDGRKVHHRFGAGPYGKGIYTSPDHKFAGGYSPDSQVFVCLSLPGNQFNATCDTCFGASLRTGWQTMGFF